MAHLQAENPGKSRLLRAVFAMVSCYGIYSVACVDGGRNSIIGTPSRWTLSDC